MLEKLLQAWKIKEVRNGLLFVLAMMVLFRVTAHIPLPGAETPEDVDVHNDLAYSASADSAHKLDFYAPRAADFPVVVFIHGGDWRIGDRSQYRGLGNRLARAGIGVAIPNFRLMGIAANRHPAQVEDLAEAVAWVHQHVREFGGDPALSAACASASFSDARTRSFNCIQSACTATCQALL